MNISSYNPVTSASRNPTSASNVPSASLLPGAPATASLEQQFLDYAKMSPIERMRANILKSMNLTESDVANMSPQEQQKVEDIIKEKIKEQLDKVQNGKQDGTPGQVAGTPTVAAAAPSNTPPLSSSVLAQMISVQANQQVGANASIANRRDES
jgi:hypothetical protein